MKTSALVSAGVALPAWSLWASSADPGTHVVVRGDTLSGLARQYGVTVRAIQEANNLSGTGIRIGQRLHIPTGAAGASSAPVDNTLTHRVTRGDTLGAIARTYGVSVSEIQQANSLSGTRILIGQNLLIPSRRGGSDYLARVRAQTRRINVQRDHWRMIVVHHSGIRFGNAQSYDNFHRTQRRMQNGLAYHFVIGNGIDSGDGEIEIGGRWQNQLGGGHVRSAAVNQTAIGICLVGNYMETHPTTAQMAAFTQLMDWLIGEILPARPRFAGHKEVDRNHTVCPGRNFPLEAMHRIYGS